MEEAPGKPAWKADMLHRKMQVSRKRPVSPLRFQPKSTTISPNRVSFFHPFPAGLQGQVDLGFSERIAGVLKLRSDVDVGQNLEPLSHLSPWSVETS